MYHWYSGMLPVWYGSTSKEFPQNQRSSNVSIVYAGTGVDVYTYMCTIYLFHKRESLLRVIVQSYCWESVDSKTLFSTVTTLLISNYALGVQWLKLGKGMHRKVNNHFLLASVRTYVGCKCVMSPHTPPPPCHYKFTVCDHGCTHLFLIIIANTGMMRLYV